MKKTFGLLLVILIVAFVNARKYCEDDHLCEKKTHVMCHHTVEGFLGIKWNSYWDFSSPDRKYCPSYHKYELTEGDKNFILKYHNYRRKRVAMGNETRGSNGPQPASVNIPDLEWDEELAYLAQNLVYQCNWAPADYAKYQCSNVERFNVGQNMVYTQERNSNNLKIEDHLNSWYNEVDKFNGNNVDRYHWDPSTRHYTQMIWAATTKIGCAHITYINYVKNNVRLYTNRFVCNYGPAGNVEYHPVYIRKN